MSYKVIKRFYDKNDELKTIYNVGDVFPRKGLEASKERLEELSTTNNALNEVIIEEVVEENKEEKKETDPKDEKKKPTKKKVDEDETGDKK